MRFPAWALIQGTDETEVLRPLSVTVRYLTLWMQEEYHLQTGGNKWGVTINIHKFNISIN